MSYKVKVSGHIGQEKYITTLTAGEHTLIADEPLKLGGQDKGFNPFELLASSLSACTLATLRSYVEMKGWKIKKIIVNVDLENFPKEKQAVFHRYITFEGEDLTTKEKNRLLAIAEKCPIHNLLKNKIDISTEIKEP